MTTRDDNHLLSIMVDWISKAAIGESNVKFSDEGYMEDVKSRIPEIERTLDVLRREIVRIENTSTTT